MVPPAVDTCHRAAEARWPGLECLNAPPLLRSPAFEYDVAPDGQRFLMIEPAEKPECLPLTLVGKWLTKQACTRVNHTIRLR
jgi:hypothetical protein